MRWYSRGDGGARAIGVAGLAIVLAIVLGDAAARTWWRRVETGDWELRAGLAGAMGLLVATLLLVGSSHHGPRARRLAGSLFAAACAGGGLWFAGRSVAVLAGLAHLVHAAPADPVSAVLDGAMATVLLALGLVVFLTTRSPTEPTDPAA